MKKTIKTIICTFFVLSLFVFSATKTDAQTCSTQGQPCADHENCRTSDACKTQICQLSPGNNQKTCQPNGAAVQCSMSGKACSTNSECSTPQGCSSFTCQQGACSLANGAGGGNGAPNAAPIHTGCSNDALNTAIGCIPFKSPQSFVAWFLAWGIGFSGGLAFIFIALGGIRIMTAGGNPQALQEGREMLSASISGLILIIFSVFILRLIGVEIFKIPGFV